MNNKQEDILTQTPRKLTHWQAWHLENICNMSLCSQSKCSYSNGVLFSLLRKAKCSLLNPGTLSRSRRSWSFNKTFRWNCASSGKKLKLLKARPQAMDTIFLLFFLFVADQDFYVCNIEFITCTDTLFFTSNIYFWLLYKFSHYHFSYIFSVCQSLSFSCTLSLPL